MTDPEQRDERALKRLADTAYRVSMGNSLPNQLIEAAAFYLARAPVPSREATPKSLGRISYTREHAHKPGICVFVPEDCIDEFGKLKRANRPAVLQAPDHGQDLSDISVGGWSSVDAIVDYLLEQIDNEPVAAQQVDGADGKICNLLLPAIVCALEVVDGANVRWRGPGAGGRIQFDEDLEGVPGFTAWIHPMCLPLNGQPTDLALLCDADKRGQSHTIGTIDL